MQEVLCDEHRKKRRKIGGNDFYKDILGSPKLVVAPMVEQSELVRLLSYAFGTNPHSSPLTSLGGFFLGDTVLR